MSLLIQAVYEAINDERWCDRWHGANIIFRGDDIGIYYGGVWINIELATTSYLRVESFIINFKTDFISVHHPNIVDEIYRIVCESKELSDQRIRQPEKLTFRKSVTNVINTIKKFL